MDYTKRQRERKRERKRERERVTEKTREREKDRKTERNTERVCMTEKKERQEERFFLCMCVCVHRQSYRTNLTI